MTSTSRDRRQLLLADGAAWNGIDYVEVANDQRHLLVHFLNGVAVAGTLLGQDPVAITGGEVITTVAVGSIDAPTAFSADSEGRPILAVSVAAPGDFSTYLLTIASSVLDPYFSSVAFSFKAGCPTELDCATPATSCPAPEDETVTIDYLAKDFSSFTQALSDFSAGRYPGWFERSEADVGVMLMEALASLADELSYFQDRVSAESSIETATQRLSVLRHARLVDYEPAPAMVATTLLQLEVTAGPITTPLQCRAVAADGSTVDFEVGNGLADPQTGLEQPINFLVDPRWNRYEYSGTTPGALNLAPYWWDDSQICLPAGSSQLDLSGHGHALQPGQQLLLDTAAAESADPPVREIVTLSTEEGVVPIEMNDELLNNDVTRVFLAPSTTLAHDLSKTEVAGNLVPAVQGLRRTDWFSIPGAPAPLSDVTPAPAIVRLAPNWAPASPQADYRYCLSNDPLAWIASGADDEDTSVPATPEIVLTDMTAPETPVPWIFARWLLDAHESDLVFTLTPELYSPVLTSSGTTWFDYDGDAGATIRFGYGSFGTAPTPGTLFSARYRVGGGATGNVPADTVVNIAPGQGDLVMSCTNPFPAGGGADAETISQIAENAPAKFASEPLRVVQAADYAAAAESLPFVQQAGTTFRWTGSWLTVFTTADPVGAEDLSSSELATLTEMLDRRRLAGYESYVLPPQYVSLDVSLVVCAQPAYFASDVQAAVLRTLRPGALAGRGAGFFDHSRWSFGAPLASSALFAAVQSCPGVSGVYAARYRERGAQLDWTDLPDTLTVGPDQILRIADDPSRPDAGSLSVTVEGGK